MTKSIRLPKMSLSMEEAIIVRWLVEAGRPIGKEEPIAEVETDKATVELPMPEDGVIDRFLVEAGDTVSVGQPIALLRGEAGQPAAIMPAAVPARTAAPSQSQAVGAVAMREQKPPQRIAISPSARRRARELGVDIFAVHGSGPGGRIVHRDIERAAQQAERRLSPSAADGLASGGNCAPGAGAMAEGRPLSGMRRTIAKRMTHSAQTIPQFSLTFRVDMTNMINIKQLIQGSLMRKQIKLSLTDFIVKAAAETLALHPELNASFIGDPETDDARIVEHPHVHAGLAVAVDGGLMVPVIHHADKLSIAEIAAARMARVGALRSKTYTMDDLQGGTFTLSNLGHYGVEQFQAIVNPPESFILAVGSVVDEVVVRGGRTEVRPMMRITGSFDHRIVDGAPAAAFMSELVKRLESEDWQLI